MYKSIVQARGPVSFPEHIGEREHMIPFTQRDGLPKRLARWQPTVDAMLAGIAVNDEMYIMIDQQFVEAGNTHRRDGLHIEGYWAPQYAGHIPPPVPRPGHTWITSGIHKGRPPGHRSGDNIPDDAEWGTPEFEKHEGIFLASNVIGCRAYAGKWSGHIGKMGDCRHIQPVNMREVILQPNRVYAGNVTMLHESIPHVEDCYRTVVRLNVPNLVIR